jgi:hypothetical protein
MGVPLPEVELSFVLAAESQLVPDLRLIFVERVAVLRPIGLAHAEG